MPVRALAESGYSAAAEAVFIRGLGTWTVNPANADMTRLQLLKTYRVTLTRRHHGFARGLPMYEATRQGLVDIVDDEINGEMPIFGKQRNNA